MIRNQIIHKCNNERLQDRLLFETKDITLDLVLKHAEQIEQATEDIKTPRDSTKKSESTVNYVKGMSKSKGYRNVMQHTKIRLFSLKWDSELLYYSTRGCL